VVEQRPFKAWVAGSNPAALTIFSRLALACLSLGIWSRLPTITWLIPSTRYV